VLTGVVALLIGLPAPAAAAPACPGQEAPPPPVAAGEVVPDGTAPAALPVPAEPVGGPALGTCGDLVAGGGAVPAEVTAAAFVVADLDSGAVLAVRAPHARHRPASTIKVLTALVALRALDPDLVVDGTDADLAIEGSRAGIGPGGRYTVRELLAGLLLNSGNDTAGALARALGGDAATVALMADAAADLGALDTRPGTPSGLDAPGTATSAYDLVLLFRAALAEPLFAQTITTPSVPFPGYGAMPGFVLSNSSRFLTSYPGALGGKAGFTEAARHTFVGAAERDGRRLAVAVVRGEQAPVAMTRQVAALLDLGFALPAGTPPLGELVDGPPAPPTTAPTTVPPTLPPTAPPTAPPVAAPPPAAPPASEATPSDAVAALVLGLVAIGVGCAAVGWRRRPR
jgi:D-alanyl-D-alanine carboxypeptidase (penicillin-binding protein 5/6)